jgi:hypothetical protein
MVKSLFNFLKKHLKVSKGDRQHSVVSIATLVGTSRVVVVSGEKQRFIVLHFFRKGRHRFFAFSPLPPPAGGSFIEFVAMLATLCYASPLGTKTNNFQNVNGL